MKRDLSSNAPVCHPEQSEGPHGRSKGEAPVKTCSDNHEVPRFARDDKQEMNA